MNFAMQLARASVMALVASVMMVPVAVRAQEMAPERGGELRVGMDLENSSLDPLFGSAPEYDRNVLNLFYENLIVQNLDGTYTPRLAESYDISDDGLKITFALRSGIVFHDGSPFDAAAVKLNYDRLIDPDINPNARQYVSDLVAIDAVDSSTVVLTLGAPSGAFLSGISGEAGMIVSPVALRDPDTLARHPVGTGAFVFDEWIGGTHIAAERNPEYWRNGSDGKPLPYLDKVNVRFISNSTIKINEMLAGTLDLADAIQGKDFDLILRTESLELVDHPQGHAEYMSFNNKNPLMQDINLRRAIALGVNRPAMEKIVSHGQGEINPTWVPQSSWIYTSDLPAHTYDPEAAKAAYAASGRTEPVVLSVIQRDPDVQIAQIMQAQLSEIGIKIDVQVLERQAWLDRVLNYRYDIALHRAGVPRPDPDMSFGYYYSRATRGNYSGHSDENLFMAVENGRTAVELEERRKYYADAQRILLENFYQTFFFWRPVKDVRGTNVHNVTRESSAAWRIDEVWMAQ